MKLRRLHSPRPRPTRLFNPVTLVLLLPYRNSVANHLTRRLRIFRVDLRTLFLAKLRSFVLILYDRKVRICLLLLPSDLSRPLRSFPLELALCKTFGLLLVKTRVYLHHFSRRRRLLLPDHLLVYTYNTSNRNQLIDEVSRKLFDPNSKNSGIQNRK